MTDEGKTAPTGYWWCSACKEEVGGYHVTNQEKHESCGHPVIWVEPVDAEVCPKGTMAFMKATSQAVSDFRPDVIEAAIRLVAAAEAMS